MSDGTLATVAAAMLVMLVRPRLRARVRPDMAVEMRSVQNLGSTVFCFVGGDGFVASITPNARQVLGEACERAADLHLTLSALVQPEDRHGLEDWVGRAWLSEPPPPYVLPTRDPNSGRRWLQLATPGRVALYDQETILIEIREVTEQTEHRNHARLLARALDAGTDAAYITDMDGRLEYVNGAFTRLFGYSTAEVLGRPASLLSSGRHGADFFAAMWEAIGAGEPYTGEVVNRRADGSLCTVDLTITKLPGDHLTPARYVAVARDISNRKRVAHDVDNLAFFDAITGLANHRLLRDRAQQILALTRRHGSTAALLHIDMDRLGGINARHGHITGDEVLRTVTERLKRGLREIDTLARSGGDEFLVLLSEVTDDASLARIVSRLHDSISQPFTFQGHSISLACRIGVALYPQDATSFDELVAAADKALRRAEQAKSSFEFFEHSLSAACHDRLVLERDLHWAWENDHFVLHYQPVTGTDAEMGRTGGMPRHDVVGVEALTRWPHMERGLLDPSQFIPLAERTGRILSLDRWAIATAIRQGVTWTADGWHGWVAVNLSARSLQDPELPEYVERTLLAHGFDGYRLVVEITEEAALRDPAQTARGLQALRDQGVRIALNGFGADHSSLAFLRLFPVDLLKLDRRFTANVGSNAREEPLIEMMISLAHRIGAKVVADGVETDEQVSWLKRAGCDYVQGHLVGRPVPPETVATPDPTTGT